MSLDCFSTEVISHIFEFLDDWKDLVSLSRVCKFFRQVLFGSVSRRLWLQALKGRALLGARAFVYAHPLLSHDQGASISSALSAWAATVAGGASTTTTTRSRSSIFRDQSRPVEAAVERVLTLHWDWVHVCCTATEFSSLSDAVGVASSSHDRGSVVLALPGVHRQQQPLTLSRPVIIVGLNDDSADNLANPFTALRPVTVPRVPAANSVLLDFPIVVDFNSGTEFGSREAVILCGTDTNKVASPSMSVVDGVAVLISCAMSSSAESSVVSCEQKGAVLFSNCVFAGPARAGVVCRTGLAFGRMSRITEANTGVMATKGSLVSLRKVEVDRMSGSFGVYVADSSTILLDACDVHDTALSCLLARDGATVIAEDCRVHGSKQCGVLAVGESTSIFLTSCSAHENSFSGAEIREGAFGNIWRSSFSDGFQHGMTVSKARAVILECEFLRNQYTGIMVHTGAAPEIRHCELSSNRHSGAYFTPGASGLITNCHIADNRGNGVRVKGNPLIAENVLERNAGGIGVYGKEAPVLERNTLIETRSCRRCCGGPSRRSAVHSSAQGQSFCPSFGCPARRAANKKTHRLSHAIHSSSKSDQPPPNHRREGVCVSCAATCHRGHRLGKLRFSTFYCDCFASWGKCHALPPGEKFSKYRRVDRQQRRPISSSADGGQEEDGEF